MMSFSLELGSCCIITLEELLLQLGLCDLNLHSLVDLLLVATLVVGIILNCRREQCVDEGRLAEAGLASNLSNHQYR